MIMFKKSNQEDYNKFLNRIDYGHSIITQKNYDELNEKGFTLILSDKNYWDKNDIDFDYLIKISDKLCATEGVEGGWENQKPKGENWEPSAQRISNLPNKDPIFLKLSKCADLLKGVNHVIKNPFKISSMQIRNPIPFGDRQEMHIDWRPRLFNYYNYNQCTGFIYMDDADKDNGSLHIYPGTHKLLGNPSEDYIKKNKIKKEVLKVKKYNMLILNVYTWHYAGKNKNGRKRRTIFSNYRERSEWQQLNQKKYLDKKIIENMDNFEKYLYAVRNQDKTESDWIYRYRNNYILKLFQKTRDIFYHKFLN